MNKRDAVIYLGMAICVLSIFVGLYLGLWVCVVGGVAAVINGFQSDPWNGTQIGMGVLRLLSAIIVGMCSFMGLWAGGLGVINVGEEMKE